MALDLAYRLLAYRFNLSYVPEWDESSQTYGDMVADMMANRLRAGLKLPLKKLPGHKYMARMTNEIMRTDKE